MNANRLLLKYHRELKFNGISNISTTLYVESIQSEFEASLSNSNTYWDHFDSNIRRSNVLRSKIEKNEA